MIVKTIVKDGYACYIDDSGYKDRTPEEIADTVRRVSEFIAMCLLKKKTA